MLSGEALVQRLTGLVGGHVVAGHGAGSYAVDGKIPRVVVFPASVGEVSEILRFASGEGLTAAPRGSGTKMTFGNVPERVDLVLALSRLNRVVDHEPADMTATFEAGILFREAQAVLSGNRQFIALDPPYADLATIGGILATNASGPQRLRYGASRDFLIAVRVVHADGTVTKGGAKVVKNVAGYDMNKLYIGSLGTLGIIVEATFRLYPMPAVEKTFLAPCASIDAAAMVVAGVLDSSLVPSAVELLNQESSRRIVEHAGVSWRSPSCGIAVAFGSARHEAVDAQLEAVRRMFNEAGNRAGCVLEGQAHENFWRATRDFGMDDPSPVVLKASVPLTRVGEGVNLGEKLAAALGLSIGVVSEAGCGIIRYYLTSEGASPEQSERVIAEMVKKIRAFARETGGSLVVLAAPPYIKDRLDVWGPVGSALPLMRGLKQKFDPKRVLNPGRFVDGI